MLTKMAASSRQTSFTIKMCGLLAFLVIVITSVDAVSSAQKTCKSEEFTCADKQKCIPTRWTCDGEADCPDQSDEDSVMCYGKTCSPDQFPCGEGNCVPSAWRCDGQEDCASGADEKNCSSTTCDSEEEFTCKETGKCITKRWRCDLDDDCGDNSDEEGCAPDKIKCKPEEFQCDDSGKTVNGSSSGRCILKIWKCDGDVDCQDHSDEMNCPQRNITNKCSSTEWMCANSECIHGAWRCDGEEDCVDKSDEFNCSKTTCRPGMFLCQSDNHCINSVAQCNGIKDCTDGSDELGCHPKRAKCDNHTEFDCSGDGSNCIPLSKVCDKNNDCGASEDEMPALCQKEDPCEKENGGCMQLCRFTHSGHYCACKPGFQLKDDYRCEDINECETLGTCSQICTNVKGSHKCSCYDGYIIDPKNPHYCKANGSEASLLFTNRLDMRELKLQSGHYTSLLDNLRAAIALDYDFERKRLFYSDVAKEEIRMVELGETSDAHNDLLLTKESISTPDGIAYDWIHQNLYWTDTGMNHIELFHIPNKHRKTLLASDLDEPRAIVVDPRENQGWIYWTDWGMRPRIEKAGLDGGHRQVVVDSNIQWPNGLTIDYVGNRIFWVDAKLHVIVSSDFNGENRYVVLTSMEFLKHPFAITVFEDWLYWSDWETESINKVSKFPANNSSLVSSVAISLYSPMDVHVYHPFKQPASPNYCSNNNGGCSHLCLPSPQFTGSSSRFRCACPNNTPPYMTMLKDNTDCVLEEDLPTAHPQPNGPHGGHMGSSTPQPHGANHSQIDGSTKSAPNEPGVGRIAGIVVAIIGALVIVAAIVGFLVYRSLMKKNVKSMNFDNPVYRKTTVDDQIVLEKSQFQPSRSLPSTLEPLTAGSNEYV